MYLNFQLKFIAILGKEKSTIAIDDIRGLPREKENVTNVFTPSKYIYIYVSRIESFIYFTSSFPSSVPLIWSVKLRQITTS